MTIFKNSVNAFGNSAGDDMSKHVTKWCGPKSAGFPKGKLDRYPSLDVSSGNRRLAKAKVGTGEAGTTFRKGVNAFSRGKK
jgi:hypothetical protein